MDVRPQVVHKRRPAADAQARGEPREARGKPGEHIEQGDCALGADVFVGRPWPPPPPTPPHPSGTSSAISPGGLHAPDTRLTLPLQRRYYSRMSTQRAMTTRPQGGLAKLRACTREPCECASSPRLSAVEGARLLSLRLCAPPKDVVARVLETVEDRHGGRGDGCIRRPGRRSTTRTAADCRPHGPLAPLPC